MGSSALPAAFLNSILKCSPNPSTNEVVFFFFQFSKKLNDNDEKNIYIILVNPKTCKTYP